MQECERLIQLTKEYYKNISSIHHKDRDCHFFINHVYSYGDKPHWVIKHYGYNAELPKKLNDHEYNTYQEAYNALCQWLEGIVEESRTWKQQEEDMYRSWAAAGSKRTDLPEHDCDKYINRSY